MYQIRHWLPSSWVFFSLWVWGPPAVMWRNRQIHAVILHGNRRPAASSQLPVFPRDGGWQSVKKGSCVRGCMLRKYVFSCCMFLCLCRPASAVRGWIQSRKRLCKKHPKVISVGLWQEWGGGLEEGGGGWMSWSSLLKPAATCLHVLNLWNVFLPETMRRRFLLLLPTLFMELAADRVNVNRRNGPSLSVCLHEVGSDLKLHCTLLEKKRNTPMSSSPPPSSLTLWSQEEKFTQTQEVKTWKFGGKCFTFYTFLQQTETSAQIFPNDEELWPSAKKFTTDKERNTMKMWSDISNV